MVSRDFTTPGVYIDETSSRPPSITEQPSAVPAFIGHTARAQTPAGTSLHLTPTRIASLVDYEHAFGGPVQEPATVSFRTNRLQPSGLELVGVLPDTGTPTHCLYWALRHYFDNGGADCYVVSTGDCQTAPTAATLAAGVAAAQNESAVTLLVVPEAAALPAWSAFATVTSAVLRQCTALIGRFAILDVWNGDVGLTAAVDVADAGFTANPMLVIDASRLAWTDGLAHAAAYYPFLVTAYPRFQFTPDSIIRITIDGRPSGTLEALAMQVPAQASAARNALAAIHVILPPSGAVAGVYAQTDRNRGVWKAPANVSLNATLAPAVTVVDAQQASLNVDAVTGKSINVIRSFTGKGTLVWGARTLLGNSNEWRYVSVRRFIGLIERSINESTQWVVFEPNEPATWARLVASVENYLTQLWRNGALQGTKPGDAFWVQCGLGQTMTVADVSAGRLKLSVALAVTRPAEFQLLGVSYSVQPA